LNIIKYKEREQDLNLKTKMSKCMANASFYGLKFRTIDLMINFVGRILTSLLLLQFELENGRFESWTLMKVLGLCLSFPSI